MTTKPITDPAIATRDYPVKNARWALEKDWNDEMRMVLWAVTTHWRIEFYDSGKFNVTGNPPAEALIAAGCLYRGIPTPDTAARELDAWEAELATEPSSESKSASVAYAIAAKIVRGQEDVGGPKRSSIMDRCVALSKELNKHYRAFTVFMSSIEDIKRLSAEMAKVEFGPRLVEVRAPALGATIDVLKSLTTGAPLTTIAQAIEYLETALGIMDSEAGMDAYSFDVVRPDDHNAN